MNLIRANTENFNVTLPGLSSREVLEETRRIRPDLTVALTNAYGKETVNATFAGLGVRHYIQKPFQLEDLVAFLQGALASREV